MTRGNNTADVKKKTVPNERLRRARERRNLTQSELAEKLGVTPVTVSRWENGNSFPTPYYRQRLCEFFQMDDEALGLIPPEGSETMLVQNTLPVIWNVPYRHNPFFTGREAILKRIHALYGSGKVTALTQTQAISGLGGIGKTQIVVEYAYRYHKEYKAVLWIRADSHELIISDFITIAHYLDLREKDEQDQSLIVAAVKRWLREHSDWLLILDNADDVQVVSDFVSPLGAGHVLLTTRTQNTGTFAQPIEVKKMETEEGTLFLLRRAAIVALDKSLDNVSKVDRSLAEKITVILDGLPLAIDQAGAYIHETACGLNGYLERYQNWSSHLLGTRDVWRKSEHPDAVSITWALSFARVQQANPVAADLLHFCSFLHPDAMPEEIIMEGVPELGTRLESLPAAQFKLDFAIGDLRRFSLVERDPNSKTLIIHRLVQSVLKQSMDEDTQKQWLERVVRAIDKVFPEVEFRTWQQCQRYLPHVQACAALIEQRHIVFVEAARLLTQAGYYLWMRGQFSQAEPLHKQALDIRKEILGSKHPDVAQSLSNLALLYSDQGQYDQAEPLYRRALAVYEHSLGPDHAEVARTLNNLAELYREQGKYDQAKYERAEALYRRAQAILEKVEGGQSLRLAYILSNRAAIYFAWHEYSQAKTLLLQALAICKKILQTGDPSMARLLGNLADIYCAEDAYDQAEPLYQQALAILEETLGEHPYIAQVLNNLGELYDKQGKYDQAEHCYQESLKIYEQVGALEHPDMATVLENYALLLRKMKHESEAVERERQAQVIRNKHTKGRL